MPIDINLDLTLTSSLQCEGTASAPHENNNGGENLVDNLENDAITNLVPLDLNQPPCINVEPEASSRDDREYEGAHLAGQDVSDVRETPHVTDFLDSPLNFTKRGFLSNEQRTSISNLLLDSCHEGKLKRGIIPTICSLYGVHRSVIKRIWSQVQNTGDASHKKTKNCGRKSVDLDIQRVREVPIMKRQTIRSLASALNTNKTSLMRIVKAGNIRRCSNAIKPHLKEENKIARLRFCLSMLEENSIPHDPKFKSMHNVIHIDEKWFYLTKRSLNCYILPDEEEPHRTCKNKNFIVKLMFLVAVARPRFNEEGKETFSGKIGVFPLVYEQEARRTSANRAAGTLEKKPITSITKEVSKKRLIDKVLSAIKEKWPTKDFGKTIYIQQDNARAHVSIDDEDFKEAASEGGFDIRLTFQPPNSPDLNVLDLGFFRAIQSLQQQEATNSVDSLIDAVKKSFEDFSVISSEKKFLSYQANMIEVMKSKGSNHHKLPHLRKDVEYKHGFPIQLSCDSSLVQEVCRYLEHVANSS